jgi:rRNA maturation protein Nop10
VKCPHCGGDIDMQRRGGHARAAKMTAKQKSESARKAVTVRWDKYRKTQKKL